MRSGGIIAESDIVFELPWRVQRSLHCFFFSLVTAFLPAGEVGSTAVVAAAAVPSAAAACLRASSSFSFRIVSSRYHSET